MDAIATYPRARLVIGLQTSPQISEGREDINSEVLAIHHDSADVRHMKEVPVELSGNALAQQPLQHWLRGAYKRQPIRKQAPPENSCAL